MCIVFMCAHMGICMYAHVMYIYVCMGICVCMYVCCVICVYVHECIYVCIYMYVSVCMQIYGVCG